MGSFTDFLEDAFLDHVFNKVSYTPPAAVFVALATADPTDTATGASMSEVANSNGYVRTAITLGAAAAQRVTQSGAVTFPQASGGGWGTVTHWAIVSTASYGAGDVLAHGAFVASKLINAGNTPSIATTEIYVEFDAAEISDYLANIWLDRAFRNQAYATPDTYIAGIITNPVTNSMTGSTITEPSGNGYARELIDENGGSTPVWGLAAGTTPTEVDNDDDVDLGPASGGNWGSLIGAAICDAVTVGNLLMFDNAMTDQDVDDGDTMRFPAGDLDMQSS
jgi:hypothetical protein